MIKEINIPNGWKEIELGNLGTFSKGKGLSKSELKDGGYPCIRYGEIYTKHDIKIKEFYSFIDEDSAKNSKKVQLNDLLFAGSGETLSEIGKCVSYNLSHKAYVGSDIIILRFSSDAIISIYASYFINSIGRKQLNKMGSGNSVVHIYAKDLEKVKIVLPPLQEQKAIADILEKWDEAIEKTTKLIEAKKKRFDWVRTELLDQVKNKNWQISRLSKISTIKKGEQLNRSELEGFGDYPAWNGGINPSGYTDKWNTLENTITISEGGNSCGFVNYCEQKFWCGGHCYSLLDVSKKIDPEFLYFFLKSKEKSIMRLRVGSGLPNIQKKDIDKLEVSYPELPQQKQIAKTLNTAKKEITILEEILANYKSQKKGLMQKLLTGKIRVNNINSTNI